MSRPGGAPRSLPPRRAAAGLLAAAVAAPFAAAGVYAVPQLVMTGNPGALGLAALVWMIGLPVALTGAFGVGAPALVALRGRLTLSGLTCLGAGALAGLIAGLAWFFALTPVLRLVVWPGALWFGWLCAVCGALGGLVFWRVVRP